MKSPEQKLPFEAAWRQKLTPADEARMRAFLAADPSAQPGWNEELGLNELLKRLHEPPVSSNFTARVMAVIELDGSAGRRTVQHGWWNRLRSMGLIQRAAVGAVVLTVAGVSFYQFQTYSRAELARSVVAVSGVATLPSLEALENFDAIKRLRQVSTPIDVDLLVALQ